MPTLMEATKVTPKSTSYSPISKLSVEARDAWVNGGQMGSAGSTSSDLGMHLRAINDSSASDKETNIWIDVLAPQFAKIYRETKGLKVPFTDEFADLLTTYVAKGINAGLEWHQIPGYRQIRDWYEKSQRRYH